MKLMHSLLALVALSAGSSAIAQTAPTGTPAAAATAQAGVANANMTAAEQAAQQANMNAGERARYEEDRAAYLSALRSHNRNAAMDERIYNRQQQAYADAMYAWRIQVADCKRGSQRACNAPTPDPANFW